ncbi:fumarylacetoacetate hydrolase family protein [Pseudorhodoplanes sp.]|uniref:fumarylacetoacetate hydrolase family protein n=1 Tax=Pseudorhodoplanes sp. TaxID=1934341 RepID=UPI003D0A5BDC
MTAALDDPRIQAGMRRQFALLEERKRSGARRIGWKVGFGAPAAKEKLKIESALVGFLLDRAVLPDGASVSLAGWSKPVAEPEIAIEIGRDVPGLASEQEAAQCVAAIGPAIELADIDRPLDDVESILAGDIFQRHVIFGPRQAVALPGGLSALTGEAIRNGHAIAVPSDLEANTGRLLDTVRQVAATLTAFGESLRAGDVMIAGSVTPPLMLDVDDRALSWELRPIGKVGVNFNA